MQSHNKLSYIVAIATSIFAAIFAIEQIYNHDLWWHLQYGDWVLEHKEILRTDPFSFSTHGAPWINTAWLGGVLFSIINHLAGLDALILFKAFIIGISFGGGCLFLTREGLNPYIAALLIGYAVVTARFRFLLRPLIFMFPFTVALMWILSTDLFERKKVLFMSVPLTIIWVNLHGSAYLAPVFSSLLFLEKFIEWIWQKLKSIPSSFPVHELLLTSLLGLAILLTPFGLDSLKLILDRFLVQDIIARTTNVQEHLPLEWGSHKMFWGLFFATGLSFLFNIKKRRLFTLFIFIATAWLALSSIRYAGLVSLVYAIILGLNLKGVSFLKMKSGSAKPIYHIILSVILITIACFSFKQTFGPTKVYQWGLGINKSRFPVEAVAFLQNENFSGNIFNLWKDGGYILYYLPNAKTFIDGRGLSEQLDISEKIANMPHQDFKEYLDSNNVQGALLSNSDQLYVNFFEISPQFHLAYLGDKHVIYLRGNNRKILGREALNFRFIRPQGFDFQYLIPLASGNQVKQVEEEFLSALEHFPNNFSIIFQFSLFLDILNRPEAVDYYMKAAKINPSLAFSHFDIGLKCGRTALKHQKWAEGEEILKMSLDYENTKSETYFLLGTALYKLKKYDTAEKYYKKHLELEPNAATSLSNLGFLYIDTFEYEKAIQCFTTAIELQPQFESAFYGYALALDKQGHPEAVEAWKTFSKRFPNSKWTPKSK